jgi:hypothetical protein
LAVTVTLAAPEPSVTAVPLDNTALAPLEGAVNVTIWLATGVPNESVTVTWSGLPKALFTLADCGVPPEAVRLAGTPGVDPPTIRRLLAPPADRSAFGWSLIVVTSFFTVQVSDAQAAGTTVIVTITTLIGSRVPTATMAPAPSPVMVQVPTVD